MSKGNKQQFAELAKAMEGGKAFNMGQIEDVLKFNIEELPVAVQRRVKALKNIHKDHVSLEKKYRDEVAELERKYQKLYAPLYLKRASVVNGEHEPTDDEARIEGEEPAAAPTDEKKADKDVKGIPEFWLTVFKNNVAVAQSITEEDEAALAFLQDIRYQGVEEGKQGFAITFHFAENPFFTDSVLTKTYHLAEDDNMYGELVFDHAEGSPINWKQGKNLTVKIVKHTQKARGGRGKKGGATRVTTKEEPCDSFFNFFKPPQRENDDAEDEDEEEGLLDDLLEADFELGCIFKDKLVPHSVLWYTGEAAEFEDDYDDDFGFDGEFDEDDQDDDDEEDEDDDEEEEMPRKGRGQPPAKKGGGGGGAKGALPAPTQKGGNPGQPQQPECKQQ